MWGGADWGRYPAPNDLSLFLTGLSVCGAVCGCFVLCLGLVARPCCLAWCCAVLPGYGAVSRLFVTMLIGGF